MNDSVQLFGRILRDRGRCYRRFLAANAFVLFVLGPLILGGTWWVLDRYLEMARVPLAAGLAGSPSPGPLGLFLVALVTTLGLPATRRELFPQRTAEVCLEALPIREGVRFHVALFACWAHQGAVWVVAMASLVALRGSLPPLAETAGWGLRLGAVLLTLALGEMVLIQTRLRLAGGRRGLAVAFVVAAAAMTAAVAAGAAWPRYLLLPWWSGAAGMEAAVAAALDVAPMSSAMAGILWWATTTALLYGAAAFLYLTFRRRDLERAESLVRPARSGLGAFVLRFAERSLRRVASGQGEAFIALLVRDLLMVGRRFSPVVYLAAAFSTLCLAATHLAVPGLELAATARWRLLLLGSLVAVFCSVALVPLVLKSQLSRLWIEKSTAVTPQAIWRTKLGLALVLALGPATLATLLLLLSPLPTVDGAARGWIVLQFLAASFVLTTIVGLASFEIAAQPVLGLIFGSFVGLAVASLFIFYPLVWWIWILFYGWAAGKLAERASRQVYLTEVER
jgi:hypothetical protein